MIQAEGLCKYYGPVRALEDVSFEIQRGEIVGFLGLNGAGKTTLLHILACLQLPSSGRVTVDGWDAAASPFEIRRRVGFLPDVAPLYPEMEVAGYLGFVARLKGVPAADVPRRVNAVCATTGLSGVADRIVGTLSHGYKQRVGIAQAIVHDPPVLILDEPITGLDPVQIVQMRNLIRGLGGRHTVLLSSHILHEISQTCDRILMIQRGRIVAQGSEHELARSLEQALEVELQVRGPAAEVLALLHRQPQVTAVQLVREDGEVVHLNLSLGADVREALAAALVGAGFGVRKLARRDAELESIFMRLTQPVEAAV